MCLGSNFRPHLAPDLFVTPIPYRRDDNDNDNDDGNHEYDDDNDDDAMRVIRRKRRGGYSNL